MVRSIHEEELASFLTKGYISDVDLVADIDRVWRRKQVEFVEFVNEEHPDRSVGIPVTQMMEPGEIAIALVEVVGKQVIRIKAEDARTMHLKVPGRPNAVFKLGRATWKTVSQGVKLFYAFMDPVSLGALFAIWFLIELPEFIRALMKCYIVVEDDKERLVFETVWELQNRIAVKDFIALKEQDYDRAYGKTFPTLGQITDELEGVMGEAEVKATLIDLKEKDVVTTSGSRWGISFW